MAKRDVWGQSGLYGTYEGERGNPTQWRSEFHQRFTKDEIVAILESDSPYDILGVAIDATIAMIKKAFRNLMKIHHPDKGGDTEQAKKIIAAYQQLTT